jgi:hypothetical protein
MAEEHGIPSYFLRLRGDLSSTHLGVYQIMSLLGAGGMGEMYRARDTQPRRDVAIKVRCRKRLRTTQTDSHDFSAKLSCSQP